MRASSRKRRAAPSFLDPLGGWVGEPTLGASSSEGGLVDTSVWVDHFRYLNDALVELLELDLAMAHPLVVGELDCGTPPNRVQVLADLNQLQQTQQASLREVIAFVEREPL